VKIVATAALPAARTALSIAAGVSVGALLAIVAAVRGAKAVHPHGVVHTARLTVPKTDAPLAAARLFAAPQTHAALVRFSRSLGLPHAVPDLLGMSIRVLDAYGPGRHQDFLLVTSADWPVLHHLFLPAGDVQQRPYTSSLPYRIGSRRFIVGALPHPQSPRPAGDTELDRAGAAAATGRMRFHLAVATPMGRFRPVAELHIGPPLPPSADALRFSPLNAGGGLQPIGMLNEMRRYAYPMSQWAWGRTPRDGSRAQHHADRLSRQATH
jgi:hypothetical protein